MTSNKKITASALIVLVIGFIATAAGATWIQGSPYGGGFNLAAALLYGAGLLCGLIGTTLAMVALFSRD